MNFKNFLILLSIGMVLSFVGCSNQSGNPLKADATTPAEQAIGTANDVINLDNDVVYISEDANGHVLGKTQYVKFGVKWTRDTVCWSVPINTSDPVADYDNRLKYCFDAWDGISGIKLARVPSSLGNIQIGFTGSVAGATMGTTSITTVGSMIKSVRIQMYESNGNGDINWSRYNGNMLMTALMHEVGHALGLDHSADAASLMYPSFTIGSFKLLNKDDINGIQSIYYLDPKQSSSQPYAPVAGSARLQLFNGSQYKSFIDWATVASNWSLLSSGYYPTSVR
jgi:hypothetical protein